MIHKQRNEDSFDLENLIEQLKMRYCVHPGENKKDYPNLNCKNAEMHQLQ